MKIKNLFCAGMAAIMLTSAAFPVNAVTTETPAEYNHSDNEEIENDKLYISGCYVEDTSVLELLENGMPPAVKAEFDDSSKPEETN